MLNLSNYQCIIFDLDGTLLDSTQVWAKGDMDFLGKRGIPVTKEYMQEIKTHTFESGSIYTKQKYNLPESTDEIMKEWYEAALEAYTDKVILKPYVKEFIEKNHLNLSMDGSLNPRDAFGSHDDADHVYNTPRAWYMERCLNPHTKVWDGEHADYTPQSDDIPWCMVPEKKITVEDVKYVLSSHFQGTPYDPYAAYGEKNMRGAYRSIGINRNDFLAVIQMRPGMEHDCNVIEWIAFASNAFNVLVPFYADIDETPDYLCNTTGEVSTDNFYWSGRMIAAMADASYRSSVFHIERYKEHVLAKGHELINRYDALLSQATDAAKRKEIRHEANRAVAGMLKKETTDTLDKVLFELSGQMKNAYARSDA